MYRSGLLLLCLAVLSLTAAAQHARPNINVLCPSDVTAEGGTFDVTATRSPSWVAREKAAAKFAWTLSAGTIVEGQGSDSIKVKVAAGTAPTTVTVTINGIYAESITESCSIEPKAPKPESKFVGEFTLQNSDQAEAGFDAYFAELEKDPTATGHILIAAANKQMANRMRNFTERRISAKKFDPDRIVIKELPFTRPGSLKLYVVPSGADAPTPQ